MANMTVKVIIEAIDKASGVMKEVSSKFQATGKKMATAGKSMMRSITLPIVGIGTAAIKTAADFDTQMRAANQMMKVNGKVFNTMKSDIQKLAITTGRSTTEMAESLYNVASAGFRGEESFKVLKVVGEAASAGLADATAVTSTLTKALNIFGYSGDQARDTMDKMFRIVDAGLLTFEELASSFPRAATQAGALGISMEEVGAALATVTKTAGSTEQAATAINGVMTGLIKPTDSLKESVSNWGYENVQAAIKSEGLTGILGRLKEEAGGNVEKMGKLFTNTRALKALFPLIGESADDYTNALKTLGDETITVNKYFKEMAEGPGFKMRQAWISLTVAGQKFGDVVAPAIEKVAAGISKLAGWFSNLSPKTQKFIAIALALLAALGPVLFIVGQLITVIGTFGIVLGVILSPIGAVIALVGLFSAALIYLLRNNEILYENMKLIWTNIKTFFITILNSIIKYIGDISTKLTNAWSKIWTGFKDIATASMEGVKSIVMSIVDWIWSKITWITDKIKGVIDTFKGAFKTIGGSISSGFQSAKGALGFAEGGIVPGPIGAPIPAIVHGGETIIPSGRTLGNINITITGNTFMSDDEAAVKIGDMIINELKLGNRI